MKLLNVFGLVVGAHLAVFTVIFATPGCRSTGKQAPKPEDTLAANAASPVTPVDTIAPMSATAMNASDLATPTAVTPVAPGADAAVAPETGIRFAPTRPSVAVVAAAPETAAKATHTVAKGDNLWSIAKKYGIGVDELAAANQLAKSATLRLGQQLTVPAKAAASAAVSPDSDAANTYVVKSGDTLGAIARKHGTNAASLRAANNLSGDNLRVGQKLVIPGNATRVASDLAAPAAAPAAPAKGSAGSYTVVPGDTLGSIARTHGVKVGDLATANTITDPAKLRVGQVLKLPAGAKAAVAKPAAKSAPAAAKAAPAASIPVAPAEAAAPAPVVPVAPSAAVEPMAVPVIRID